MRCLRTDLVGGKHDERDYVYYLGEVLIWSSYRGLVVGKVNL
jgi:hypothetical protein